MFIVQRKKYVVVFSDTLGLVLSVVDGIVVVMLMEPNYLAYLVKRSNVGIRVRQLVLHVKYLGSSVDCETSS